MGHGERIGRSRRNVGAHVGNEIRHRERQAPPERGYRRSGIGCRLRRETPRPARPRPRSASVAGSGTLAPRGGCTPLNSDTESAPLGSNPAAAASMAANLRTAANAIESPVLASSSKSMSSL